MDDFDGFDDFYEDEGPVRTVLNFWTASTANMMSVMNTIHMTA
jgi:hypothetical protein